MITTRLVSVGVLFALSVGSTASCAYSAADSDEIFIGQVNATGYLLTRMITEAKKISKEHVTLWREEIAESQKD